MELVLGSDKRKNPEKHEFRSMLLEEVKALSCGQRVWFLANDGTARGIKVNGQPKRWKREPDRVEVPVKYGMSEYSTFRGVDRFLVPMSPDFPYFA